MIVINIRVCACVTEVISIPCSGISGQQLFEYMRNHDKGYGMRTLYMAPSMFDITLETQVRDMYIFFLLFLSFLVFGTKTFSNKL